MAKQRIIGYLAAQPATGSAKYEMRFHELTAAKHIGIVDAPLKAVELPRSKKTASTGEPNAYQKHVRLVFRFMAAVYREVDLSIVHGDPDASININAPWISFPEPYTEAGDISEHCRQWIIEMCRDAAMTLGLGFCILFDDGPVYARPDGDLVTGGRAPSGGLRL